MLHIFFVVNVYNIVCICLILQCKAINKFNKLMYELVGLYFVELRIRLITKVVFGWFSPVFTQLTKPSFLDFELTNSETALGCFQVMSYVNSVAIGIILDKSWVPQQCVVTSLQTHGSFSGTFVLTFPKTHASLLHLTFPFPSPKPTAHQQLN